MALDPVASPPTASPAGAVRVRALGPADAAFAAGLHARALPHGFFARLGLRYLAAYHASFAASPFAVALVATAGDRPEPVGLLVGTLDNRAHYRWVVRHRLVRLALAGALGLARRPRLAATFVRTRAARYVRSVTRLRRSGAPAGDRGAGGGRVGVLTHVAVDPAARGLGAGARLVDLYVRAARSASAERVALVTLAGGSGAGPFYERLGWEPVDERLDRDGRPVVEYALPPARRP